MVVKLKENIDALKHEVILGKEVEENKTMPCSELKRDKEELYKALTEKKKENEAFVIEMETLRENNGSLNKNNSDLDIQLNVNRDLIKGLTEALSAKDPEIVEISVSGINMTKEPMANRCNACGKRFKTSSNLENHINDKHTQKSCIYCDKVCKNDNDLINHQKECEDMFFCG